MPLFYRAGFLGFLLLAGSLFSQGSQAARSLDLRNAVNEALQNNPSLQEVREKHRQTQATKTGAWSVLLPNVSSSLSVQKDKDAVLFGQARFSGQPYNFYNFGLQVQQPLFDRKVFGGLSRENANEKLAAVATEISTRELVGQVAKSFSQILYWQRHAETLRGLSRVMQESLKAIQNRVRIGRSDRIDALQMQTQLALLEPRIARAENGIRTSTASLMQLLGWPAVEHLSIVGHLEVPAPDDVLKTVDLEASQLPQLRQLAYEKDVLEAERSVQLGAHWPSLNAQATWARQSFTKDDLFDGATTRWSVGLVLQVPLFSGLSSIHERRVFASREFQLRHKETALRNSLEMTQIQSLENLRLAYSQIQSNQTALKMAEESQNEGKRQYRFGTIDLSQLLNIQRDVLEASVALEEARIRYVESLVDYFSATGLPMNDLVSVLSEGPSP